jgi:hypothetical protein
MDVSDCHRFVDRLAHIVNGECSNGNTAQSFHFDSSLGIGYGGTTDADSFTEILECDFDVLNRQSVAKRNQFAGPFCGQDSCNLRRREDIAFGDLGLINLCQSGRLKADGSFGYRNASLDRFS